MLTRTPVFFLALVLCLLPLTSIAGESPVTSFNGVVLNGTVNGRGVGRREVALHQIKGDDASVMGRTKTDAAGSFSFPGIKADPDAIYVLTSQYEGVEYFTGPIRLNETALPRQKLMIFETTDQPPELRISMHHIIFERGENALSVKEVMIVENPGNRTFTGNRLLAPGKRETLKISLPDRATGIEFAPMLDPVSTDSGKGFSVTAPLRPGRTEVTFGYGIPSVGKTYTFSKALHLKTDTVSVVSAAQDLRLKSDQLVAGAAPSGSGKSFTQWSGKDFPGGTRITAQLNFSLPFLYFQWVVVALIVIFLGTGLVFAFRRKRNTTMLPGIAETEPDPIVSQLESQRQAVLRSIAELDELAEAGDLDSETYHRQRTLLFEEARELSARLLSENPQAPEVGQA